MIVGGTYTTFFVSVPALKNPPHSVHISTNEYYTAGPEPWLCRHVTNCASWFMWRTRPLVVTLCNGGAWEWGQSENPPIWPPAGWASCSVSKTVKYTTGLHSLAFIVFYKENIMNGIIARMRRGASGVTSCQGNRQDIRMGLQLIFGWRNSLPANLALSPSSSSILQVRGHRSQSVCSGFIGLLTVWFSSANFYFGNQRCFHCKK